MFSRVRHAKRRDQVDPTPIRDMVSGLILSPAPNFHDHVRAEEHCKQVLFGLLRAIDAGDLVEATKFFEAKYTICDGNPLNPKHHYFACCLNLPTTYVSIFNQLDLDDDFAEPFLEFMLHFHYLLASGDYLTDRSTPGINDAHIDDILKAFADAMKADIRAEIKQFWQQRARPLKKEVKPMMRTAELPEEKTWTEDQVDRFKEEVRKHLDTAEAATKIRQQNRNIEPDERRVARQREMREGVKAIDSRTTAKDYAELHYNGIQSDVGRLASWLQWGTGRSGGFMGKSYTFEAAKSIHDEFWKIDAEKPELDMDKPRLSPR